MSNAWADLRPVFGAIGCIAVIAVLIVGILLSVLVSKGVSMLERRLSPYYFGARS